MRDPERIPMILAALEREWRKDPDSRLGQLIVNLLRSNMNPPREEEGKRLFAMEDGALLRWLGPDSQEERTYIAEEPRKAREGWAEWERQFSQSEAYRNWRQRWEKRSDEQDS